MGGKTTTGPSLPKGKEKIKLNHVNIKFRVNELIDSFFFKMYIVMSNTGTTGRLPLWLVGTVIGMAALTLVGIFFYGSYVGLGSSL